MKVLVKEGWVNQDTGKKSEPRIQLLVQYLQDVLDDFAKKADRIT
jgi:DNA polymerase-3 subunit alpha